MRGDLQPCAGCGKTCRPFQSKREAYPGTVAKGRTNPTVLCMTCHQRLNKMGTLDQKALPEATPEQKSATLSLLQHHNALDLAPMLGLQREEQA